LIVVPLHIHSLAGACEPAWMFLPTLPFQPSIEDPDSVGTVDCQLPLYISPCSQVLYLQHLWDPLVCVANKRLTAKLSPLDATFTRNRGVESSYWKTFQPRRCKCKTEEREGAKRKGGPKPALTEREAMTNSDYEPPLMSSRARLSAFLPSVRKLASAFST